MNETKQTGWQVAIVTRIGCYASEIQLTVRPSAKVYSSYVKANAYAERLNQAYGSVIAAVVAAR